MEMTLIARGGINNKPFTHYGVVLNGWVFDLTPGQQIKRCSFEEFSKGLPVKVLDKRDIDHDTWSQRIKTLLNKPYNLILHNCEHFAKWLFYGCPWSQQVLNLGILGIALSLICPPILRVFLCFISFFVILLQLPVF